jgi:AraC-like DNA-binding protein
MALRGMLIHLLTEILRNNMYGYDLASSERRKITPALEAIRKQPDKVWTTLELAEMTGFHPTYFASLFRKIVGHPPKHYIVLERIRHAKMLLLRQEDKIETISRQLGYTSVHYFCRNFKQITGFTPSEFKRRNFEL